MVGVNARNCYFDLQLDIQKESVRSEKRERLYNPQQNKIIVIIAFWKCGVDFDIETYTVTDTEMLINQLNYREQLNDIKQIKDFPSLMNLLDSVTEKQRTIEAQLTSLFGENTTENAEQIKASLCELQFFNKLAIEIELVEEHLMD